MAHWIKATTPLCKGCRLQTLNWALEFVIFHNS